MENLIAGEEISFMARIRSIKPDFWTDEKIVELSPLARLLFIGMWNFVDDYGRAEYSPLRLKMQILPADTADILEILGEIRGKRLIRVYEVENKEYFEVTGFAKHQKIDKRTSSKIPNPPSLPTSPPESPRIPSAEVEVEGKGKEEKKKEKTLRDSDESTPRSLRRWFDEVMWPSVPKKVGKDLTWEKIKTLKPDERTKAQIVDYFTRYPKIKAEYDEAGIFYAEMQDPVRVIKNRRYLDVLTPPDTTANGSSTVPKDNSWTEYCDIKAYRKAKAEGKKNITLSWELKHKYPEEV